MPRELKKYRLGIALSGGGAKGFAHLGVYQALFERGIYPDIIAGTSAGAFASIFIADGQEPKDVLKHFKNKAFRQFVEFMIPQGGLFNSDGLITFLKKHVTARTFEELKIPMKVIATDIENGCSRVFDSGELIPAVVASCSVPIVFKPIKIGENYYVDGGLFKNFPVTTIRKECEILIGINVSPITAMPYKNSFKYVTERLFHYLTTSNTIADRTKCDYLFESHDPMEYSMFDLDHVEQIYQLGYDLAQVLMCEQEANFLRDFPQMQMIK